MNVSEPIDIAAMSDDDFDQWMSSLPPPPGLPSTPQEIAASDARALADVATDRCYPHPLVREWLETAASPDYTPSREWLASRNG